REAIIVQSLEGRITYWNKGAERMYGLSSEQAEAGLAAAVAPDAVKTQKAWASVLESGQWDGTLTQTTREGREIIVESHWTLLRRPDGKPRAVLIVGSDVTAARLMESQLLRTQ